MSISTSEEAETEQVVKEWTLTAKRFATLTIQLANYKVAREASKEIRDTLDYIDEQLKGRKEELDHLFAHGDHKLYQKLLRKEIGQIKRLSGLIQDELSKQIARKLMHRALKVGLLVVIAGAIIIGLNHNVFSGWLW